MSILLQSRREEEVALLVNYYSGFYDKFLGFRLEKTAQYPKIKMFLTPVVYQRRLTRRIGRIDVGTSIDDTISRATTWKTLFGDKPLPDVEENAVEKYAGSLDQYLPEGVPVDKVVRHAKG